MSRLSCATEGCAHVICLDEVVDARLVLVDGRYYTRRHAPAPEAVAA